MPTHAGGRRGAIEVYRAENVELRAGDRIRWTRNDARLGLVNSHTAEVTAVAKGRVAFRLEDGRTLELPRYDPQLRHIDHAWASTVHAFQGRTVDRVIAVMEANHPNLTTQKASTSKSAEPGTPPNSLPTTETRCESDSRPRPESASPRSRRSKQRPERQPSKTAMLPEQHRNRSQIPRPALPLQRSGMIEAPSRSRRESSANSACDAATVSHVAASLRR